MLRRAVSCTGEHPSVQHACEDEAFAHVMRLLGDGEMSEGTAAAVYAGLAVYMALLGADTLFTKTWRHWCHNAQVTHRRALAAAGSGK